jgi:hypothetical protein
MSSPAVPWQRLLTVDILQSLRFYLHSLLCRTESESHVATDGQPASLSWNKAPIWGLRPDLYYLCDSYGLDLVGRPL